MNREDVMELLQKTIKVNTSEEVITHQFHIGEDMNVPDAKEDIVKILQNYGKLHIQECQKMEQYLKVKGYLAYQILYATEDEERTISCLEGTLPMEEMVYVDGGEAEKYFVKCNQLDMQSTLIHSRKMNMKSLVELQIQKSSVKEQEITLDVDSEMKVMKKHKKEQILEFSNSIRDVYRIKEEVKLPATKENIGKVLLSRIGNVQLETRMGNDEIILHGEFQFFCMYISDEWKEDYVAQSVAFEGKLACMGIEETLFHHLRYQVEGLSVDTQMDEDGELRILNIEAVINIEANVYEEKECEVLDDIYMLEKKCMLNTEPIYAESLILQNQSKCKIIESLILPELRDELLQICTASGVVQVELIQVKKEGIEIEGILHVDILYVCGNDRYPYASWQGMIPFTHNIECSNEDEIIYDIESYLEQVSVSMAGNGELEVKAAVNFHSFMRKPKILNSISDIKVEEFTLSELEEQAGIIGYVYKEGEDLWNLAKRFHTTVEGILKNNKISEKEIKAGQKLLIFKENISIL